MDNEMGSEQLQSPSPSEPADMGMSESVAEERSTGSATPVAEDVATVTPSKPHGKRSPFVLMRSGERYRVTKTINKYLMSEKASMVATQDRVEKLYQLREECIATAEKASKGSLRENFAGEMNEDEERSLVVKHFAEYISGFKAPVERNGSVGLMRNQPLRRDRNRGEEINKDDPEPEPFRRRIKSEVKDESRNSLADLSDMPKSGLFAGMAITRGFCDARLAAGPVQKTSVERIWKQIGGKWMPLPLLSLKGAASERAKRKLESVDREVEGKKIKLEAEV